MCSYSDDEIKRLATKLAAWPANGKPEMDDDVHLLIACGFVEEIDQKTPCKTCGVPRISYSFMKLTQAGKLFLAAARKCMA